MQFIINNPKLIYNIIILVITILTICFNSDTILCDGESISEQWFATDNNTNQGIEPKQAIYQEESVQPEIYQQRSIHYVPPTLTFSQKIGRKMSWFLTKDLIDYKQFKKNYYPSRNASDQIKNEIKDFFRNPYNYSNHQRDTLISNNLMFCKRHPKGSFFVQGIGYVHVKEVERIIKEHGFVVHNNRYIWVNTQNLSKILSIINGRNI